MRGIAKVFVKDLHEMVGRPYIGVWLIVVPIVLLYVASNSIVDPPQTRVLLNDNITGELSKADIRNLLLEFSEIRVLERDWEEADTATVMGQEKAHLALVAHPERQIFIRPASSQQMERLKVLAYQIAASLAFRKPWQVEILEASRNEGSGTADDEQLNFGGIVSVGLVAVGSSAIQRNIVLIPKIICLIVAFLPFLVSCTAIIRDKENEMLGVQLAAPGISWMDIILGKSITAIFFAIAGLFAMLLFAVTVLDVPARTGVWPIVGIQFLAILVSTTLGLVASTLVKSQLQAYFISAVYGFSLMFLTGLLYPIEQAHPIVQVISRLVPLTFSHGPMTDWMLHGLYGWPFAEETLWLTGQSLVGAALAAGSYVVARRTI